jgi:parvulin-like peptidyl-prolyl isomerase
VKEIRNRFGTDFAKAVKNLEPGSWYGPIRSTYGFHAVYIYARQEANLPKLENIIDRVKNDWMFANQEENKRRVYKEIRSRYRVLVEGLPYDLDAKG